MVNLDEVEANVIVKNIMISPVVTAYEHDSVEKVAKMMATKNIGGIVITGKDKNPVGIITERDIVKRVAAKNLLPKEVKAREVMSTPLATIDADADINDAARKMSKFDIRRLAVMEKGSLVGIITSKDIVSIMPELAEIIAEKVRITSPPIQRRRTLLAGYCSHCGQWSNTLEEVNGDFLCEECRLEM
jgi:CBS domain-containing protein